MRQQGMYRMNKILNATKWIIHNFFLLTLALLVIVFIRWFWLTPIRLSYDTAGIIAGIILLIISGAIVGSIWRANKDGNADAVVVMASIALLGINYWYIDIHYPRVITTAKCNGARYTITRYSPLFDEQLEYRNLSIWKGVLYKSFFFGSSGIGGYKIICDEGKREANFVDTYNHVLYYTDGENARIYEEYVGAKLRGHRYFISRELDYTNCNPLPIHYQRENSAKLLELRIDKKANEISLYEEGVHLSNIYSESPNCPPGITTNETIHDEEEDTLIFTYGENPRCYVDGCSITNE
jgi:hypothetical protein